MLVAITSSKGGAGKTTLTAIAASSMFVYKDVKIAVADLDPQASLINKRNRETKDVSNLHVNSKMYKAMAKGIEEKGRPYADIIQMDLFMPFEDIRKKLNALAEMYDIVFVDFPGSLNLHKNTLLLLTVLDKIFVPFQVDENSFDSTFPFASSLYEFKKSKKTNADIHVFFNKYHDKGKNASEFKNAYAFLSKQGMNVMDNHVYEDVSVERYETIVPPRRSLAKKNIHHWVDEMYDIITTKK